MNSFKHITLPTRHDEAWKYTDLRALNALTFSAGASHDSIAHLLAQNVINTHDRLVFINGVLSLEHSQLVTVGLTHDVLAQSHALTTLSPTAQVGVLLSDETQLTVSFIHTDGSFSYPQLSITVSENAQCTLHQETLGVGTYFSQPELTLILKQNSSLKHTHLYTGSETAFHHVPIHVTQAKASQYDYLSNLSGSALSRQALTVELQGEKAHCSLKGLYQANQQQQVDTQTLVQHQASNTSSDEYFKGIIDEQARGIFNGKIFVPKQVGQINADMTNKNLLLSAQAEMNTKPQLEIYADDVQCSHGATVGELDHEALFYLQSRGIPKETALTLLRQAFIDDILKDFALLQGTQAKEAIA